EEDDRSAFVLSFFVLDFCGWSQRASMVSLGVWLKTLVLEMLLLVRALQGRFLRKYSLFYVYLGIVFFQSLALLIVYLQSAKYYRPFYWYEIGRASCRERV